MNDRGREEELKKGRHGRREDKGSVGETIGKEGDR